MLLLTQAVLILFGLFLIGAGFVMLLKPEKAQATIAKAGSTPLINYSELLIRMIPAAAMIYFAEQSQSPMIFKYLGWFMIGSSIVLMILPRTWHHAYAVKSAEILRPNLMRLVSPLSIAFGIAVIYVVL